MFSKIGNTKKFENRLEILYKLSYILNIKCFDYQTI